MRDIKYPQSPQHLSFYSEVEIVVSRFVSDVGQLKENHQKVPQRKRAKNEEEKENSRCRKKKPKNHPLGTSSQETRHIRHILLIEIGICGWRKSMSFLHTHTSECIKSDSISSLCLLRKSAFAMDLLQILNFAR